MRLKKTKAVRDAVAIYKRIMATEDHLYDYVREVVLSLPNYVDGKHIKVMCDTIEDFLKSDRPGLIITTPPRHMKSTICSECLPAWFISNDHQRSTRCFWRCWP